MRYYSCFFAVDSWMLVGTLAASLLAGSAQAQYPPRVCTLADNGHTYSLKRGQALTVQLPSNPTTGYSWQFVGPKPSQLHLADSSYRATPAARGLVGSGGTQNWKFTAKQPGKAVVQLAYHRPWEKLAAADKRYTLVLVIK